MIQKNCEKNGELYLFSLLLLLFFRLNKILAGYLRTRSQISEKQSF